MRVTGQPPTFPVIHNTLVGSPALSPGKAKSGHIWPVLLLCVGMKAGEAMSFDLFVGSPNTRIVRTKDLLAYYGTETDWDSGPARDGGPIDPRIEQFAKELATAWPPMNPAGPLQEVAGDDDDRATGYSFGPTSVYLDFRWSCSSEAYEKVRDLALHHRLLFFNCSGEEWINGISSPERGKAGKIYLVDREDDGGRAVEMSGETTWIDPADADLLTDADWFRPNFHFGFEFGDQHYMQCVNTGDTYIIEYRSGSPDRHFQAKTTSLDLIRQSFRLYSQGDDRAFSLLIYKNLRG